MQKELLKQYEKLEIKFKALEAERQALRVQILKDLVKNKLDKVDSDYGSFTVCSKTSWVYTDKVKKLEERVKTAKFTEQQKGLATATESEYLLYKENKD